MSSRDNLPNDEEQEAAVPTDCRALLAMTRPLVIAEDTPLSSREEKIRDPGSGAPAEERDLRGEFTLRKGKILRAHKREPGTKGDEDPRARKEETGKKSVPEGEDGTGETGSDLPETDSNLQMRIYLGMS
jgi:hypothetical protein